jgi:hypothetical protein
MIVACTAMVDGQTGSSPAHKADEKQPAAGLYQRQAATRPHEQKDDFFTASTKLVNKNDLDYGAMIERRRQAFLDASAANPFFWYSALTTGLLMVLMLAYGVRVMDEKRKLWRAAEILNDVWNDAQYARALAETAIQKYNRHMEECNRVIEAQLSGRASPTALEATDARNELTRLRGELDTVDSERKVLKAKLDDKERTRLRQQALDWLRQDLTWWGERLDKAGAETSAQAQVRDRLRHWQGDPDLVGVRAKDALAGLPDEERQRWERLWSDVGALLRRVSAPD